MSVGILAGAGYPLLFSSRFAPLFTDAARPLRHFTALRDGASRWTSGRIAT